MNEKRLLQLAHVLAAIGDDPRFWLEGYEGADGRYDPIVVATRQPEFQELGFSLKKGRPYYDYLPEYPGAKKKPLEGVEAVKVFFAITTPDVNFLFTPLGYGRPGAYVSPREVAGRLRRFVATAERTFPR
jgi:hypothetical protein